MLLVTWQLIISLLELPPQLQTLLGTHKLYYYKNILAPAQLDTHFSFPDSNFYFMVRTALASYKHRKKYQFASKIFIQQNFEKIVLIFWHNFCKGSHESRKKWKMLMIFSHLFLLLDGLKKLFAFLDEFDNFWVLQISVSTAHCGVW